MMPSHELEPNEALATAKGAAERNQLQYTKHAQFDRMPQRRVQARDVKSAILTSKKATWRNEDKSWKLTGGRDFDGESLDVAIAIEANVVRVVTVF